MLGTIATFAATQGLSLAAGFLATMLKEALLNYQARQKEKRDAEAARMVAEREPDLRYIRGPTPRLAAPASPEAGGIFTTTTKGTPNA
jgi:uncharacterized protein with von Willebrand factor type A (vWA) domain